MSSRLAAIYTALAAMPVPVGGALASVRNYDALPASVAAGDTPVRLLMPLSAQPGGGVSVVTFSGAQQADWRIADLLLLRPAQAGRLEQAAALMVEYQVNYAAAVANARGLAGAFIQSLTMDAGVFTYPAGGTAQWFGVEVKLTLREVWR